MIQYKDQRFEDAAQNFKEAKDTLGDNPLYGRAMLGYAVSLIKSESGLEEGKKVLVELADNEKALLADRWEAHFLLAVQALAENDERVLRRDRLVYRLMKMRVPILIDWWN